MRLHFLLHSVRLHVIPVVIDTADVTVTLWLRGICQVVLFPSVIN